MLPAAALAILVLVAATPVKKIEPVPKLEAPKLDFKLPDTPKADNLSGPAKDKDLETRQAAGDLRSVTAGKPGGGARVESAMHAKEFVATKAGYKPTTRLDAFAVGSLPARTGPFKSCVRVSTTDGVPVSLRATIKSPAGTELLASDRVDVTFGSATSMDVVIEWPGFEATVAGEHKLSVSLDGRPAGEFPLVVQGR